MKSIKLSEKRRRLIAYRLTRGFLMKEIETAEHILETQITKCLNILFDAIYTEEERKFMIEHPEMFKEAQFDTDTLGVTSFKVKMRVGYDMPSLITSSLIRYKFLIHAPLDVASKNSIKAELRKIQKTYDSIKSYRKQQYLCLSEVITELENFNTTAQLLKAHSYLTPLLQDIFKKQISVNNKPKNTYRSSILRQMYNRVKENYVNSK